jgi:hypothetical protein
MYLGSSTSEKGKKANIDSEHCTARHSNRYATTQVSDSQSHGSIAIALALALALPRL